MRNNKNKLYIIDIGCIILLIIKLTKIIMGIKVMLTKYPIKENIIITICATGSFFWFCYFIKNTQVYIFIESIESILTFVLFTLLGIYIVYKNLYLKINITIFYSIVLIAIGFIDALLDISILNNLTSYDSSVTYAIICDTFYIIAGIILLFLLINHQKNK